MDSLGAVLRRYREGQPLLNTRGEVRPDLPEEAFCAMCQQPLPNHPSIVAWMQWRGFMDQDGRVTRAIPVCQCREARERRVLEMQDVANLPVHAGGGFKVFANFKMRTGSKDGLWAAQRFSRGVGERCLLLSGEQGTGKSHLLEAIGRACLDQGLQCRYDMAPDLLVRLRSGFDRNAQEDYTELRGFYAIVPVLLLDDIGLQTSTPFAVQELTGLIDQRIRDGRWLAVATNLSRAEMAGVHDGTWLRLASRLYDRGSGSVRVVYMVCGDYRAGMA